MSELITTCELNDLKPTDLDSTSTTIKDNSLLQLDLMYIRRRNVNNYMIICTSSISLIIQILFIPSDPDFSIDLENGLLIDLMYDIHYPIVPLQVRFPQSFLSYELRTLLSDIFNSIAALYKKSCIKEILKYIDRNIEEYIKFGITIKPGSYNIKLYDNINKKLESYKLELQRENNRLLELEKVKELEKMRELEKVKELEKMRELEKVKELERLKELNNKPIEIKSIPKVMPKVLIDKPRLQPTFKDIDEFKAELKNGPKSEAKEVIVEPLKVEPVKEEIIAPVKSQYPKWTETQDKNLEKALLTFPASIPVAERWDKIAEFVQKPKKECIREFKRIRDELKEKELNSKQVEEEKIFEPIQEEIQNYSEPVPRKLKFKVRSLLPDTEKVEKTYDLTISRDDQLVDISRKLQEQKFEKKIPSLPAIDKKIILEELHEEDNKTDSEEIKEKELIPKVSLVSHHKGTQVTIESNMKGIGLISPGSFHCILTCDRCSLQLEQLMVQDFLVHTECSRCRQEIAFRFRPQFLHIASTTFGYVDIDSAYLFDYMPTDFNLTCMECSTVNPLLTARKLVQFNLNCISCHSKLSFRIESISFTILSEVSLIVRKTKPKSTLQFITGQPLPDNGICQHYEKSFRWMRFPCCDIAYPCHYCHDIKSDHEAILAKRMICGTCSLEQPFSNKPCICGQLFLYHSVHWEGGKGCRDRNRMSNNDPKKYAGLNKTISRRAILKKYPQLKEKK